MGRYFLDGKSFSWLSSICINVIKCLAHHESAEGNKLRRAMIQIRLVEGECPCDHPAWGDLRLQQFWFCSTDWMKMLHSQP